MKVIAYILLSLFTFTSTSYAQLVTNRALYDPGRFAGARFIVLGKDGQYFGASQNCYDTYLAIGTWSQHKDTLIITPVNDTTWKPSYKVVYSDKRLQKDSITITVYDKYNEIADPDFSLSFYDSAKNRHETMLYRRPNTIGLNQYTWMLYNGYYDDSLLPVQIKDVDIALYFNMPADVIGGGGIILSKEEPVKLLVRRHGLYSIPDYKLIYKYSD